MQLNIKKRTIWLTRHGESEYNVDNRIGGDPSLTENGQRYGVALGKFLKQHYTQLQQQQAGSSPLSLSTNSAPPSSISTTSAIEQTVSALHLLTDDNFGTEGDSSSINVWTSTLRRTIETVESFDERLFDIKQIRFLNEIYAGSCENLTYEELERLHPDEFVSRAKNKLIYRYPGAGGESYVNNLGDSEFSSSLSLSKFSHLLTNPCPSL